VGTTILVLLEDTGDVGSVAESRVAAGSMEHELVRGILVLFAPFPGAKNLALSS
jgi:hypothetical protein